MRVYEPYFPKNGTSFIKRTVVDNQTVIKLYKTVKKSTGPCELKLNTTIRDRDVINNRLKGLLDVSSDRMELSP